MGQIHAIDPDLGRNGQVFYGLQSGSNNTEFFSVEQKSGKILVSNHSLTAGRHLLFVEAADQPINPSERRTSLAVVTVNVKSYKGKGLREWVF